MMAQAEDLCPGCFLKRATVFGCNRCGWHNAMDANPPGSLQNGTQLGGRCLIGGMQAQYPAGYVYGAFDLKHGVALDLYEYFPRRYVCRGTDGHSVQVLNPKQADGAIPGIRHFAVAVQQVEHISTRLHPGRLMWNLTENGTVYFALQAVEYETLRASVEKRHGPLTTRQVTDVVAGVIAELDTLHQERLTYQHVNPDTLILRAGRLEAELLVTLRIRELGQSAAATRKPISLDAFSAEEQYRADDPPGPWTDVYGLAATIYWALTGRPPPEAPVRLSGDAELIPPRRLGVKMSARAEKALLKALSVSPDGRWRSVSAFQKEWLASIEQGPVFLRPFRQPFQPLSLPSFLSKTHLGKTRPTAKPERWPALAPVARPSARPMIASAVTWAAVLATVVAGTVMITYLVYRRSEPVTKSVETSALPRPTPPPMSTLSERDRPTRPITPDKSHLRLRIFAGTERLAESARLVLEGAGYGEVLITSVNYQGELAIKFGAGSKNAIDEIAAVIEKNGLLRLEKANYMQVFSESDSEVYLNLPSRNGSTQPRTVGKNN